MSEFLIVLCGLIINEELNFTYKYLHLYITDIG